MMQLRQLLFLALLILTGPAISWSSEDRPNVLILTVDDMSCDSVGAFGCALADTTPNIDQLAASGLRYHYAHVQVGNCYPSRNVMLSGRYPHNTGVEGFYQVRKPGYLHLVDLMQAEGYFVAIRGKVSHSTPYQPYAWDSDLTVLDGKKQHVKDVQSYYKSTKRGIELAAEAGKPFCLNVNISDPHKPFYGTSNKGKEFDDPHVPSKIFEGDEVPIPGFLFDHPNVRKELAQYYSSVRRADDCVGEVLRAIQESDHEKDTLIIFLSDHGMPLPFAKTALWHHSTRTPWIVRWPGVTQAGAVDKEHMISAVDLMPTLLEAIGAEAPQSIEAMKGMDGQSFFPTLSGQQLEQDREFVYKVYNENSGGHRNPMRSVQSKRFGYIFNAWSDGKREFLTATRGTMTYRAMKSAAKQDKFIAGRLEHFEHNVLEEFYDYENDPDALHNLIDDPNYASELAKHREKMLEYMVATQDPMRHAFEQRANPQVVSDYVDEVQRQSDIRRAKKKKKPKNSQNRK